MMDALHFLLVDLLLCQRVSVVSHPSCLQLVDLSLISSLLFCLFLSACECPSFILFSAWWPLSCLVSACQRVSTTPPSSCLPPGDPSLALSLLISVWVLPVMCPICLLRPLSLSLLPGCECCPSLAFPSIWCLLTFISLFLWILASLWVPSLVCPICCLLTSLAVSACQRVSAISFLSHSLSADLSFSVSFYKLVSVTFHLSHSLPADLFWSVSACQDVSTAPCACCLVPTDVSQSVCYVSMWVLLHICPACYLDGFLLVIFRNRMYISFSHFLNLKKWG